jgi:hypothetical protein
MPHVRRPGGPPGRLLTLRQPVRLGGVLTTLAQSTATPAHRHRARVLCTGELPHAGVPVDLPRKPGYAFVPADYVEAHRRAARHGPRRASTARG